VTLKTLVTGVAALAVVGGAAAGVTSIAATSVTATPDVAPVVFGVPMPLQPDLQQPLVTTLNALAGSGSFGGTKEAYIQGGVGRIEAVTADRAYANAAAKGLFPLSFDVANVAPAPGGVTADVTATAANGQTATQNVLFVNGPSPTGWQLSKSSALALLSAV
jgi:hypothetical protein